MPVKVDVVPPPPANSKQPGVTKSLLYNGSRFQGSQKSKGNSYDVEVVLQVSPVSSSLLQPPCAPSPRCSDRCPRTAPLCRHFSEIAPQIGERVSPLRPTDRGISSVTVRIMCETMISSRPSFASSFSLFRLFAADRSTRIRVEPILM